MAMELPHIILIVMDTVSAKRCSLYGHTRSTTPGLARVATDAVVYRHCFAPAAWTLPSHISLFTGLFPGQHGGNNMNFIYPGEYYTLPEVLKDSGYATMAISSNLLISRQTKFNVGFDEFHSMESLYSTDRYYHMRETIKALKPQIKSDLKEAGLILQKSWAEKYPFYPVQHILDRIYRKYWGNINEYSAHATKRTFQLAKKLLKKPRNSPVFLFINVMEAHDKYNPPRRFLTAIDREQLKASSLNKMDALDFYFDPPELPYEKELVRRLYEQEVTYLDEVLSDFMHFLGKAGLQDDTLLIVTADHGESLGEHGIYGHFFGLYNELIHVPLLIKYPRSFGLKGDNRQLVQLHDLFATLVEVSRAPYPVPPTSTSLLDQRRTQAFAEFPDISIQLGRFLRRLGTIPRHEFMQPCRCVIDDDLYKLMEWADGSLALFDLKTDYAEANNLLPQARFQGLARALQQNLRENLGEFQYNDTVEDDSEPVAL
ncbi:MAG: sulfatase [Desulfobaccales bacterium]